MKVLSKLTTTPVDYSLLPAYSTVVIAKVAGTWPGVPFTRTDIIVIWKGPDPSPATVSSRTLNSAGMLNNVDLRIVTT